MEQNNPKSILQPVGKFIIEQTDIDPCVGLDGSWYHYKDVVTLIKRYSDEVNKALQAKCERYENVLKGMVKKVHSRHITDGDNRLANELCNEANEALSAGGGERENLKP